MGSKAEIFLCELKLHHQRRLRRGAKQGMKWFPWLKIDRAIFYLHQYIFSELAIQRFELIISLFETVGIFLIAVYKGAPYDNAAVRGHGICEHVGAIGMRTLIILGAGLPF